MNGGDVNRCMADRWPLPGRSVIVVAGNVSPNTDTLGTYLDPRVHCFVCICIMAARYFVAVVTRVS